MNDVRPPSSPISPWRLLSISGDARLDAKYWTIALLKLAYYSLLRIPLGYVYRITNTGEVISGETDKSNTICHSSILLHL